LNSGQNIAVAGPAGALIAYLVIGFMVFCFMVCMGEMATFLPVKPSPREKKTQRAFSNHASFLILRYRDPSTITPLVSSTPVWVSPLVGTTGKAS
jgi:L-asparagine transporter-like permease